MLVLGPDLFLCSRGFRGSVGGAKYLRSEEVLAGPEVLQKDRIVILPVAIHSSASYLVLDAAEALVQKVDALVVER